jgi:hypothetical protein
VVCSFYTIMKILSQSFSDIRADFVWTIQGSEGRKLSSTSECFFFFFPDLPTSNLWSWLYKGVLVPTPCPHELIPMSLNPCGYYNPTLIFQDP